MKILVFFFIEGKKKVTKLKFLFENKMSSELEASQSFMVHILDYWIIIAIVPTVLLFVALILTVTIIAYRTKKNKYIF